MNAPCYHCPERHNLCHASCEKYLKFRAERDAMCKARRKDGEFYDSSIRNKVWKPIAGNQ